MWVPFLKYINLVTFNFIRNTIFYFFSIESYQLFYSLRVFHPCSNGWFPIKVSVTTCLLKILLAVFHPCSKWWFSIGVSVTPCLLRTLTDISSFILLMFSILPISISPRFWMGQGTVLRVLTMIVITITSILHRFFSSLARSKYLFSFSLYFIFNLLSIGTAKSTSWQSIFFL